MITGTLLTGTLLTGSSTSNINIIDNRGTWYGEGTGEDPLNAIQDDLEERMKEAPIVKEEIGSIESASNPETLKKMGFYIVFGASDHPSDFIGQALKNGNVVRCETKAQLRSAVQALNEKGFKLLDIIKGRPIYFKITTKEVKDITIGD